jgi:hypothetical protein
VKTTIGVPQVDERWVESSKMNDMRREEEKERRTKLNKVVE